MPLTSGGVVSAISDGERFAEANGFVKVGNDFFFD